MPIRSPTASRGAAAPGALSSSWIGPLSSEPAVQRQAHAERLRELARPRAEIALGHRSTAHSHQVHAVDRLERADEHRGPHPLLLAHRVEQRVDAVGEVDVGRARGAEQDVGAAREAHVGVAGGLVHVVALGLDDAPRRLAVTQNAADQAAGHVVDRAGEEVAAEPHAGASVSTWRAWASCSRTRTSAVPPSDTFDSSQASCSSSS